MTGAIWIPLLLTVLAGLSTSVGSGLALLADRTNRGFLGLSLGFSAGVMTYISFMEMMPIADEALTGKYGDWGSWHAVGAFFGGIGVIAAIDYLVPEPGNPHEGHLIEEIDEKSGVEPPQDRALMRTGVLTALAIGIDNFPEGMATFFAAMHDPTVGVSIAIAIALHNIPEGVSVAVPIYYATGSRKKAFWYSSLSGLSEPVGALVGYLVLRPYLDDATLGYVLAAVSGVMVFISLDQLIPNAKKYGRGHEAIYGLLAGMAVMAFTLLLLE